MPTAFAAGKVAGINTQKISINAPRSHWRKESWRKVVRLELREDKKSVFTDYSQMIFDEEG